MLLTGAARSAESPCAVEANGTTVPEDVNDDRESKKNEVQTTMDFAANIEKVKEVIHTHIFFSINSISNAISLALAAVRMVLGSNFK